MASSRKGFGLLGVLVLLAFLGLVGAAVTWLLGASSSSSDTVTPDTAPPTEAPAATTPAADEASVWDEVYDVFEARANAAAARAGKVWARFAE